MRNSAIFPLQFTIPINLVMYFLKRPIKRGIVRYVLYRSCGKGGSYRSHFGLVSTRQYEFGKVNAVF